MQNLSELKNQDCSSPGNEPGSVAPKAFIQPRCHSHSRNLLVGCPQFEDHGAGLFVEWEEPQIEGALVLSVEPEISQLVF